MSKPKRWRQLFRIAGHPKYHVRKLKWIKSLKVGDVVCDCRFKNLKIVEIVEEFWDRDIPHTRIKKGDLLDKQLVLEDGSNCSAKHCCTAIELCRFIFPQFIHGE